MSQSSSRSAVSASLDGTAFEGACVEKGKRAETGKPDDLIFKDGKFVSTACVKYGFHGAPYSVKTLGDGVAFESTIISVKQGEGHDGLERRREGQRCRRDISMDKGRRGAVGMAVQGEAQKEMKRCGASIQACFHRSLIF